MGLAFPLDSGTLSPPGWAWEIAFCVFVLFRASDSETGSVKFSCVLAKPWAMGWASFSLLSFSYAYVSELALVSARKSF